MDVVRQVTKGESEEEREEDTSVAAVAETGVLGARKRTGLNLVKCEKGRKFAK